MVNHGQWSSITMVTLWKWLCHGLVSHCHNHSHPWPTMVNHGQPSLTMLQCHIMTNILLIWKLITVNHGPTYHCDKYCLKLKSTMINHGHFRVYNIYYLRVYIPCVYNINPLVILYLYIVTNIVSISRLAIVNHSQPWSNITLWQRLFHSEN